MKLVSHDLDKDLLARAEEPATIAQIISGKYSRGEKVEIFQLFRCLKLNENYKGLFTLEAESGKRNFRAAFPRYNFHSIYDSEKVEIFQLFRL